MLPVSVVNQINEHAMGGFVLFYFNSENGAPEDVMTFDSPAHCLALQKHIADWSMALNDLSIQTLRENIQIIMQDDSEKDNDDGEF